MSAAGRARIAAAQKARWAKVKGGTEQAVKALVAAAKAADVTKPGKIKRTFSAAHLAKIRAAAKKRWAKAKAAGKNRL
jgi:mRNA-degrading endonuclease HigB of HigAB toxin-antitoxin module